MALKAGGFKKSGQKNGAMKRRFHELAAKRHQR